MKIFTPAQMRDFDKEAIEKYKIPSIVLMENAALRVVEFCEAKFAPIRGKCVLVVCGKGNNGGDGFAIARHLSAAGCFVTVVLACKKSDLHGDSLVNFEAMSAPQNVEPARDRRALPPQIAIIRAASDWPGADFVIDALLGTGFSGAVRRGPIKVALEKLQNFGPIVAVDVPSGVDADTGAADELAVHAEYTVTFAAPKRGFFERDGVRRCGEIWIGGIGTHEMQMSETMIGLKTTGFCEAASWATLLNRAPDAHKGDAGRVLIVGGSRGMSGAVALASRAALATGAGLCLAMVPDAILDAVAASVLEATTKPLTCDANGALTEMAFDEIAAKWTNVQCVAVGPGIGRSNETKALVQRLVRECPCPLVIDADALFALRDIADEVKARKAPTLLTPHPGEMAELLCTDTKTVQEDRFAAALSCTEKYEAIVVLKGAYSLVVDFGFTHINLSGNSGMATGGSGDVLTGVLAALCGQFRLVVESQDHPGTKRVAMNWATQIGVYLHGLAGDLAFETKGNGLVAGDIAAQLPLALKQLSVEVFPDEINPRLQRLH